MSNEKFNKSLFYRVFTANDYFIESWIDNVYNKIKNSKLLPNYITRSRENLKSNLTYSDSGVSSVLFVTDNDFTSENCILLAEASKFTLDQQINLGRNYDFSFEIKISTVFTTTEVKFGNIISVVRELAPDRYAIFVNEVQRGYNSPVDDFLKIQVKRNNSAYTIYINDVLNVSFTDTTGTDSIITGDLLEIINEGDVWISNVKILSFDQKKILHWWRLNAEENNSFIDTGLNDYDFYSFFYSIIKLFSFVVRLSKYFRLDTIEQGFMESYLVSKEINYNRQSTYLQLLEMFSHWKQILQERGTVNIINPINLVNNYSFLGADIGGDYSILCQIETPINLGKNFIIEFDVYVEDDMPNYDILDCISITKTGGELTLEIELIDSGNELTARIEDLALIDGNYNIKIVKSANEFSFYIDNVYVATDYFNVTVIAPDFNFSILFDNFKKGHNLNNLSIKYSLLEVDKEIKYQFTDIDTFFINSVDGIPELEARLFAFDELGSYILSPLFTNDIFTQKNNYQYKERDGELRQIYEATGLTELTLVKAGLYDMSWVIGSCSPLETQTYPIRGFNKLPNKDSAVNVLADYPLRSTTAKLEIDFADCVIEDNKIKIVDFPSSMTSILKSNIDGVNTYMKSWRVACMGEKSYEVSFRVKVVGSAPDFNLYFGIDSAVTNSAVTGVGKTSFFSNLNFNKEGDFWIRGIIYGNLEVLTSKPKTLTFNSLTNHLKFISSTINPVTGIDLRLIGNVGNDCVIYLYDFQFRLLSLDQTKVTIGNKDLLFLYGRNNSSNSIEEIEEKVQHLIPFSSNLKLL